MVCNAEDNFQRRIPKSAFDPPICRAVLKNIGMLNNHADKALRGTTPRHPKWIAPPKGLDKINVDAAVSKTSAHGALGVVCRSRDGSFLGALAMIVAGIVGPTTLEPMAWLLLWTLTCNALSPLFRLSPSHQQSEGYLWRKL
jgi:hypothetical protein